MTRFNRRSVRTTRSISSSGTDAAKATPGKPFGELRTPLVYLALTLIAIAISAGFLVFLVPLLIAHVYSGESSALLGAMMPGRSVTALDRYLHAWNRVAFWLVFSELGLGVSLAVASWPWFQHMVDARLSPPAGADTLMRLPIRRGQLALATGVIAFVVGTQLLDIVTQTEHWPFSPYRMYSGEQSRTISRLRLYGVTDYGEIELTPDHYLRPFDRTRLPHALELPPFDRIELRPVAEAALNNLHALYERGRKTGTHRGPPLRALRLYRLEWMIDGSLANKNKPDKRELLHDLPIAN